ncbi:Beta-hexosaminidase [Histomonas meleagridis]|uniref:Beta-hexosaminidase n=1 Tax=Histomonas meleagridis TaxID=135588 RepID=UPI00355A15AA|nr:Beta-hexosaminidase [Histomonas meleagridis]KAH0798549.1 Beta-hexosaminidase [Histomonas meleagridis]
MLAFIALASSKMIPNIIPAPVSMEIGSGEWVLTTSSVIMYDPSQEGLFFISNYLADFIRKSTFIPIKVSNVTNTTGIIFKKVTGLEKEEYTLNVDASGVTISASEYNGFFYGVQTLLQLFPVEIFSRAYTPGITWSVPFIKISDKPRLQWRGFMLDCSRHFFDVTTIKHVLDTMALHKINTFHWHLVDDQGWRIEIKKYPLLTQKGVINDQQPIPWHRLEYDGKPYGPYFYTQEEIKEVIAYAKKLCITIVPEIEMPGHAIGALSGYPEFCCRGEGDFRPLTYWGGSYDVFCPGNDGTIKFLEDILDEVIELFDSEYIHCGGDECRKLRWEECPKCQKRIQDHGLKDVNELQSWFVNEIANYVESKGRHMIGWDEIMQGGLPKAASVMSWQGVEGGTKAAQQGHYVVMAPNPILYVDHGQLPVAEPYEYIVDYTTSNLNHLYKVYTFEPTDGIPDEYKKYIIGAQCNLFAEYVWGDRMDVDYKYFPRMSALSEVTWSKLEYRSMENFLAKLARVHNERLTRYGINIGPITGHQKIHWTKDQIKSNAFTSHVWDINGGVGITGQYQAVFIMESGSNNVAVRNVKILYDGEEVACDASQKLVTENNTPSFDFIINENAGNHRVELSAEISGLDGNDSFGEIIVYITNPNQIKSVNN